MAASRRLLGSVLLVLVGAVAAWWFLRRDPAPAVPASGRAAAKRADPPPSGSASELAPPSAKGDAAPARGKKSRKRDPEARARWESARARIRAQLAQADDDAPPATRRRGANDDAEDTAPAPKLDAKYIQDVVRDEVAPAAQECYEDSLAERPDLAGRLVLDFKILGDESVGGIVDEVQFAEGSEIDDADLRDCLSEAMGSAVFAAPDEGGEVGVTYPFMFSPEPPSN